MIFLCIYDQRRVRNLSRDDIPDAILGVELCPGLSVVCRIDDVISSLEGVEKAAEGQGV